MHTVSTLSEVLGLNEPGYSTHIQLCKRDSCRFLGTKQPKRIAWNSTQSLRKSEAIYLSRYHRDFRQITLLNHLVSSQLSLLTACFPPLAHTCKVNNTAVWGMHHMNKCGRLVSNFCNFHLLKVVEHVRMLTIPCMVFISLVSWWKPHCPDESPADIDEGPAPS